MDQTISLTNNDCQTLAIAGLLQSCHQVSMIARQGRWNDSASATCVYSLFQIDANSVIEVYGELHGLKSGLRQLKDLLEKKIGRADMEITRYAITLLNLERKLVRDKSMMNTIRQNLFAIKNEFDINDTANPELQSRIANVYSTTVSTIPPKVQVEGNREHLSSANNTNKVRAMLFAGIRSAVLWRQLGGRRWSLFTNKRGILRSTEHLLEI